MVGGIGYNSARWPGGKQPRYLDLRRIVSNLAVMDFGGPDHAIQVISLHPGVTFDQVQENTGFELAKADEIGTTVAPTDDQLEVLSRLDPHEMRATVFKGNPTGAAE